MERNKKVDILRCILCFLVIGIHTVNINIITKIAVPTFFILSGYFIYGKSERNVAGNVKRIFLILIFANIFYAIWSFIVNYHNLRYSFWQQTTNVKNWFGFIIFNQSIYRGHLWYLGALLYCHIIYYLEVRYKKISDKLRTIIVIVLFAFLILLTEILQIKEGLYYRNFIFMGLPYYYVGMIIKSKYKKTTSNKYYYLLTVILIFLNYLEVYMLYRNKLNYLPAHYVCTIFLSVMLVLVSITGKHRNKKSILAEIGQKYSLYIYLFHVIIIDVINMVQYKFKFKLNQYIIWFMTFIITTLLVKIIITIKERWKKYESIINWRNRDSEY